MLAHLQASASMEVEAIEQFYKRHRLAVRAQMLTLVLDLLPNLLPQYISITSHHQKEDKLQAQKSSHLPKEKDMFDVLGERYLKSKQ
jgi:hypothetical protein